MPNSPRAGLRFTAVVATLVLVLGLESASTQAAGYRLLSRRTVAPGVVFIRLYDPSGPNHIFILNVDLSKSPRFDVAVAPRSLGGVERTSAMAADHGAAVAVNGDFGGRSGRPTHILAEDGTLKFTSIVRWGFNVSVTQNETGRYIGLAAPAIRAWLPNSSVPLVVKKWNSGPPWPGRVAGFSSAGGKHSPRGTCGIRLSKVNSRRWTAGRRAVSRTYRVVARRCGRLPTARSVVLAARPYGLPAARLRRLHVGQRVRLTWTVGWPGVLDTIGGDPLLVSDGQAAVPAMCPSYFCHRNPRTGIGFGSDGHLLLVVVDGRRPGWSAGMTLLEFANVFVYLGATTALNLDGGGSSTMVVRHQVVNRPSDGHERRVSSAVLIMRGASSRTSLTIRRPTPEGAPGGSTEAALTDPGSTRGLLDARSSGALGPP